MKIVLFLFLSVIASYLQKSEGCHSAAHGGIGTGVNGAFERPDFELGGESSIEERLSGHGLPASIVSCVIQTMNAGKRKKRFNFDPSDFPIGPAPVRPGRPDDLQSECRNNNRQLCLTVLECAVAQEQTKIVNQLSFLTPPPPTTTTTTTTTPIPPLPEIELPHFPFPGKPIPNFPVPSFPLPSFPFPNIPVPNLPGIPDFNFPGFPKLPTIPKCRNSCKGFVCRLRCDRK